MVERYFRPDLMILGGGVSKELPRYAKYLQARAPLVPAAMLNTSGIVGAAMAAERRSGAAEAEAEAADRSWAERERGRRGAFGRAARTALTDPVWRSGDAGRALPRSSRASTANSCGRARAP